jgi:hypothetical protein
VPGLGAFWTIAIALAVALAGYVLLLVRFTESPGRHHRSSESRVLSSPEQWVTPRFGRAAVTPDSDAARWPWVRVLAEEQSA